MEGHRLAVRILGVACTTHGFAFAVTEGPERLIDWGRRQRTSHHDTAQELERILTKNRPLFVACEIARNEKRSNRARTFNEALKAACAKYDLMILCVERRSTDLGSPTNQDIAQAAANQFPVIAGKLPTKRRIWDGADDRIGILFAAASASAGWRYFRRSNSEHDGV